MTVSPRPSDVTSVGNVTGAAVSVARLKGSRSEKLGDGSPLGVGEFGALLAHDAAGQRVENRLRRPLPQRGDRGHARIGAAGMTRRTVVVENGSAARSLREGENENEKQHRVTAYRDHEDTKTRRRSSSSCGLRAFVSSRSRQRCLVRAAVDPGNSIVP